MLLTALFVPSMGFSITKMLHPLNLQNKMFKKEAQAQGKDIEKEKGEENCPDFTGNWKGRCVAIWDGNPEEYEDNIRIEQWSCSDIVIDQMDYFNINGQKVTTDSSRWGNNSMSMLLDWNHERNKLEFRMTFSGRFDYQNRVAVSEGTGYYSMSKSGNQLYFSGKSIHNVNRITEGEKNTYESNSACTYELVGE